MDPELLRRIGEYLGLPTGIQRGLPVPPGTPPPPGFPTTVPTPLPGPVPPLAGVPPVPDMPPPPYQPPTPGPTPQEMVPGSMLGATTDWGAQAQAVIDMLQSATTGRVEPRRGPMAPADVARVEAAARPGEPEAVGTPFRPGGAPQAAPGRPAPPPQRPEQAPTAQPPRPPRQTTEDILVERTLSDMGARPDVQPQVPAGPGGELPPQGEPPGLTQMTPGQQSVVDQASALWEGIKGVLQSGTGPPLDSAGNPIMEPTSAPVGPPAPSTAAGPPSKQATQYGPGTTAEPSRQGGYGAGPAAAPVTRTPTATAQPPAGSGAGGAPVTPTPTAAAPAGPPTPAPTAAGPAPAIAREMRGKDDLWKTLGIVGLALMRPQAPGGNWLSHVGDALGTGLTYQMMNAAAQQQGTQAQRKLDIEESRATSAAREAEARTGRILAMTPADVARQRAETEQTRVETDIKKRFGPAEAAARIALANAQASHRADSPEVKALTEIIKQSTDITGGFDATGFGRRLAADPRARAAAGLQQPNQAMIDVINEKIKKAGPKGEAAVRKEANDTALRAGYLPVW